MLIGMPNAAFELKTISTTAMLMNDQGIRGLPLFGQVDLCGNQLLTKFSIGHLKHFRFRKSHMVFVLISEWVLAGRNTSGEKYRSDH